MNFLGAKADHAGARAKLGGISGGHDGNREAEGCGEFSDFIDERTMSPLHEAAVFVAGAVLGTPVAAEVLHHDDIHRTATGNRFVFPVNISGGAFGGGCRVVAQANAESFGEDEVGGLVDALVFQAINFLKQIRARLGRNTLSALGAWILEAGGKFKETIEGQKATAQVFQLFDAG